MKFSSGLSKKERAEIFKLFLTKNKLKFNEIEKAIGIRSNLVSYHLEIMQKEGLLEKKNDYYYLTPEAEKFIPLFEHLIGKELSPLPVILVAIVHRDKILLVKRKKRPYQNYWSLPGGKINFAESFEEASLRIIKNKCGLTGKFISLNAFMEEKVNSSDLIKHHFLLFFTNVEVAEKNFKDKQLGELKWFNLNSLKPELLVPSDYWLIKNKLRNKLDFNKIKIEEKDGELISYSLSHQN